MSVDFHRGGLSLLSGWLPFSVFVVAAILAAAVLFGRGRWVRIGLPLCVGIGVVVALVCRARMQSAGVAGDPAPFMLWVWLALAAAVLVAAVVRFPFGRWRGRIVSVLAVPILLLAALLVVNQWVGYYRTAQVAWSALTAGPLPNQTALDDLSGLRNTTQQQGRVVPVDIADTASGFVHRTEYVYLPPAWFAGPKPPALPAVEMIGGEFNTPADWIRLGSATQAADNYAHAHAGVMPILVFVDSGGSFNNDTECVDGSRGAAASHLIKDVRPYVISQFGASADAAHWGAIGWSMGGTCAMDLAVTHPELFTAFGDIGGDLGPNTGTKQQTIDRLFGGNAAAWAQYDPQTVMAHHGAYTGLSGVFVDADGAARGGWRGHKPGGGQGGKPHTGGHNGPGGQSGLGGRQFGADPTEKGSSLTLCNQMKTVGIGCTIASVGDGHTWQSATQALSVALPAVAARLDTHLQT